MLKTCVDKKACILRMGMEFDGDYPLSELPYFLALNQ